MEGYFLNIDSALVALEEHTLIRSNYFTLLHYLTNGYLSLYFKYSGDIYEKEYSNFSQYDFDKNDFIVKSTNSLTDEYLKINLQAIKESELYAVFKHEENTITVREVFRDDLSTNHQLAKQGTHVTHDPSTTDDLLALYKFLEEEPPFRSYILMYSKDIDLADIDHEVKLTKNQLFFCSDEIEGLKSPSANKRAMNIYNRNNLSLENKLLVQYFNKKLDEVNKEKRKLTQDDRATIIHHVMISIHRTIEWTVVREQLKDPSRLIKERTH